MMLPGLSKSVNCFEKDRTIMASVSADGSVTVWDAESRRLLLHVPVILQVRVDVCVSPEI